METDCQRPKTTKNDRILSNFTKTSANPVPKGQLKIRPVQISFSEEVCWRCFWVEAPCFSRGRQRFSVAGRNLTLSCALALGFVSGHDFLAAASVSRAV